jgi:acetolactate synthase-1/2/3 large subunit
MVDVDEHELNKLQSVVDILIQADARDFLVELNRQIAAISLVGYSQWMERCKEWYKKYPVVLPEYRAQTDFVNTYVFSEVISETSDDGDLIAPGSSGAGIEIFLLAYKAKPGQRVLQTSALGAMGYGLPAAIGACIASGYQRTISVDGDGGFQLNIQELEVVKRLNLPIKFFILNNNGYASIRTSQSRYFRRLTGADKTSGFTLPDIRKVASAYGLATHLIAKPKNLYEQAREVLETPGPVVCEVLISPEEPRAPSLSSRVTSSGKMVSKPLEDLWPFLDRQEFLANMIVAPVEEPEE